MEEQTKSKELKVVKKNGAKTAFDKKKIERSIMRANMDVAPDRQMPEGRIRLISDEIQSLCEKHGGMIEASDIRYTVETQIISLGSPDLAIKYIRFGARKKCA